MGYPQGGRIRLCSTHAAPRVHFNFEDIAVYVISKSIHITNRLWKQFVIFLSVLGPGIIVMVADNDAGGISTYAVTGSKYGMSLLWMFIFLLPMAYYVQEMTVRLGAVTKRGHAEAIFEGFGPVLGLVFANRSRHRELANAYHRIHRHDRSDEPVRDSSMDHVRCSDFCPFCRRHHRQLLDL